jgi:hypothetical protein
MSNVRFFACKSLALASETQPLLDIVIMPRQASKTQNDWATQRGGSSVR